MVMLLMVMREAPIVAEAVACDPVKLLPCAPVISGQPPSIECCNALKEMKDCLCTFLKNPEYKQYLPLAKKALAACGIPFPHC